MYHCTQCSVNSNSRYFERHNLLAVREYVLKNTRSINLYAPIIVTPHAPTPGRAEVGISGDLQELFDKLPTPRDDFMLQIPCKSPIVLLV